MSSPTRSRTARSEPPATRRLFLGMLKKDMAKSRSRIEELVVELPAATEDQIGWKLVEELSIRAAKLLEPAFETSHGRDGRLSIQVDPRCIGTPRRWSRTRSPSPDWHPT